MNNDFRIGEKAVYPAHGVAEVIGIEKKEINTTVCSFYVLKVLATGMQILVPKDKADQVGLRPVATTSEIEEVDMSAQQAQDAAAPGSENKE